MYEMEGPHTVPLHRSPIARRARVARPITGFGLLTLDSGFPEPLACRGLPRLGARCL